MKKLADLFCKFVWFIGAIFCIWVLASWADLILSDGEWMFNLFAIDNWRWLKW